MKKFLFLIIFVLFSFNVLAAQQVETDIRLELENNRLKLIMNDTTYETDIPNGTVLNYSHTIIFDIKPSCGIGENCSDAIADAITNLTRELNVIEEDCKGVKTTLGSYSEIVKGVCTQEKNPICWNKTLELKSCETNCTSLVNTKETARVNCESAKTTLDNDFAKYKDDATTTKKWWLIGGGIAILLSVIFLDLKPLKKITLKSKKRTTGKDIEKGVEGADDEGDLPFSTEDPK